MVPKLCLTLMCVTLAVYVVSGAPRLIERRSPRSIDKSAALHARLRLLHKQIHDLVAEQDRQNAREREEKEEEETKNDVGNHLFDVSKLRGNAGTQMTSERQKQVQMLSKRLDESTQADLHELAETLDQLLRETMPERRVSERTNTAGEFLSDKFNKRREEDDEEEHAVSKELQSEASMDRRKEEHTEEEKEEGEEESAKRKKASLAPRRLKDGGASTHFASRPELMVDEGTFGDFVDTEEERRPSIAAQYRKELRKAVLSAIESRLLRDLQDAQGVGISVDDIIEDVQSQARKEDHLQHIENELDKLSAKD